MERRIRSVVGHFQGSVVENLGSCRESPGDRVLGLTTHPDLPPALHGETRSPTWWTTITAPAPAILDSESNFIGSPMVTRDSESKISAAPRVNLDCESNFAPRRPPHLDCESNFAGPHPLILDCESKIVPPTPVDLDSQPRCA